MGDTYYSTFYDKLTKERLHWEENDDYLYEGKHIFLNGGIEYLVVSINERESEYKDPYDGHNVDCNCYQDVYVVRADFFRGNQVTIPSSMTHVDPDVFRVCSDLSSIMVDKNNQVFDSRDDCNAIIETSSNKLIAGCKNTIIPSGVTVIGSSAFKDCRHLTSINIPDGVVEIGYRAFENCSGLISIYIPTSVTKIGYCAFKDCRGLASINIPEGVTELGYCAFESCSGLTSIHIPESVTSIGFDAFKHCTNLKHIIACKSLPQEAIKVLPKGVEVTYYNRKNVMKKLVERLRNIVLDA